MNLSHETFVDALKTAPAWIGVVIGHAAEGITLSSVALVASTIYSIVQTYIAIRRERRTK